MDRSVFVRFGANIRQHRIKKGLSQEQLADVSGLHRTYIGGVERGERNISLMNMTRLAKALEVALVELVDGIC